MQAQLRKENRDSILKKRRFCPQPTKLERSFTQIQQTFTSLITKIQSSETKKEGLEGLLQLLNESESLLYQVPTAYLGNFERCFSV